MSTTWIEAPSPEEVKKPVAGPWRKGARALARRFGTTVLMAAQDPDNPQRWAVTDLYALRFFEADSIEAQALTAFYEAEPIRFDGRTVVKVWKGGANDMAASDERRPIEWHQIIGLVHRAEFPTDNDGVPIRHVVAHELRVILGTDIAEAVDFYGIPMAVFARKVLGGVLDEGETVHVCTPWKPAAIRDGSGEIVAIAMPILDDERFPRT